MFFQIQKPWTEEISTSPLGYPLKQECTLYAQRLKGLQGSFSKLTPGGRVCSGPEQLGHCGYQLDMALVRQCLMGKSVLEGK